MPGDPVARLGRRIQAGETTLEFDPVRGYLPDLLRKLLVASDSQVLVFSKTSLQDAFITPSTPRAIYFNDEVAVAYVPGAPLIELASLDPVRGVVFYKLANARADVPAFARPDGPECARCHSAVNQFAAGMMVTSSPTQADGIPVFTGGPTLFNTTDHRMPFDRRWSGWYVTGTHGNQEHLGNLPGDGVGIASAEPTQNVVSLVGRVDTSKYLEPTSDIVALMMLDHQTKMVNLIASVNAQSRRMRSSANAREARARLDAAIEDLVAYMLFVDEAPLNGTIAGVSTFTATFAKRGPRDRRGRSLRDFDLVTRLFKYTLSYVVQTDYFRNLDAELRDTIYQRLHAALTSATPGARFSRLSRDGRRAVFDILCETEPSLPSEWECMAAP